MHSQKHEMPEVPAMAELGRQLAVTDGSGTERGGFEPPIGFDTYNGLANLYWPRRKPHTLVDLCVDIYDDLSHPLPIGRSLADPELSVVVDAWPSLPAAIKTAILAIVRLTVK